MQNLLRRLYHYPKDLVRAQLNRIATINQEPIIIIGNHKSGTSAIAALLSELTGKSATIDLPGICEPIQPQLHRKEISFETFVENNKYDFSKDIIKEPSLTFLYKDFMNYFPEATVVFIVRDPRDNIRSILNRVDIPGHLPHINQEENIRKLKEAPTDWERVIDSRWLGIEGENYIEWMAHRWNLAVDIYNKHIDSMQLIRYEDFVKDKRGAIEELAEKLGLAKGKDIAEKVDVQFQPRGKNRNIDTFTFFGPDNLKKIEDICHTRMKIFGYV
ncbi:sulfotransferase family protein [Virgibacillus sp. MSP4-1]|uniref:sulfotransferase n=1 Tax=Virgibacillus sp. MSP4-1 TaxID=2700081 RepID=UPI0003A1FBBC|nr:sulfotransferase [Virgibacillus sp. MSP4-1]QHS23510.1 sulfotransferase family protein [Virgibacillus sp. MSP4-1]